LLTPCRKCGRLQLLKIVQTAVTLLYQLKRVILLFLRVPPPDWSEVYLILFISACLQDYSVCYSNDRL
jgi:hypothetical protein